MNIIFRTGGHHDFEKFRIIFEAAFDPALAKPVTLLKSNSDPYYYMTLSYITQILKINQCQNDLEDAESCNLDAVVASIKSTTVKSSLAK